MAPSALSGSFVSACDLSSALGRLFSAVAQGQVKPKTASTLAYLGSGSRFPCRGFGIGRLVIGRLFVGGADGFAPGVGVVGVDVFVLGEGQDLD